MSTPNVSAPAQAAPIAANDPASSGNTTNNNPAAPLTGPAGAPAPFDPNPAANVNPAPSANPAANANPPAPPHTDTASPAPPAAPLATRQYGPDEPITNALNKARLIEVANEERNRRREAEEQIQELLARANAAQGGAPSAAAGPNEGAAAQATAGYGSAAGNVPFSADNARMMDDPRDARLDRLENSIAQLVQMQVAATQPGGQTPTPVADLAHGGQGLFGAQGEFSDLYSLFDQSREEELERFMRGRLDPCDIWKMVPGALRLSPEVAEETGVSWEIGQSGTVRINDGSGERNARIKRLQKLHENCPDPLGFMNAWSWFCTIAQYHYRSPRLLQSMMRFGWRIVQSCERNYWRDCLEVYVDLARPILREHMLLRNIDQFDNANFADLIRRYQPRPSRNAISGTMADNIARSQSDSALPRAPKPEEVCNNWNFNKCNGFVNGRPCTRKHKCAWCGELHPRVVCPDHLAHVAQANQQRLNATQAVLATTAPMVVPQVAWQQPPGQSGMPNVPQAFPGQSWAPMYGPYAPAPANPGYGPQQMNGNGYGGRPQGSGFNNGYARNFKKENGNNGNA